MYNIIRNSFAYFALILLNLRFFAGDILGNDTSDLTLLIAILNLLAIDYRHLKYIHYLIIAFLLVMTRDNPAVLPVVFTFVTCIGCKDVKFINAARICLCLQLCFLFYMYWNVSIGEIREHLVNYEKGVTKDLGFGNSNTFSTFVFSILCSLYLSFRNMNKLLLLVVILIISIPVYQYAMCRTVLIGTIFLSFFILYNHLLRRICANVICRFVIAIFPLIIISFIIFIMLSILEFEALNDVLTGRIQLWLEYYAAFVNNNIWFGTDLMPLINKPLDNSYINLMVTTGFVGYLSYVVVFYKSWSSEKSLMVQYSPVVFALLICGITESILVSCYSVNILLILMMYKSVVKKNI